MLGIVTGRLGSCDSAVIYLVTARALHRAAGDLRGLARDDYARAAALHDCDRFSDALSALDEAMVAAAAIRDERLLGVSATPSGATADARMAAIRRFAGSDGGAAAAAGPWPG